MYKIKVLKTVTLNNGKKSFCTLEDSYKGIDEAVEGLLEFDTSKIEKNVSSIEFIPISYEDEEEDLEIEIELNSVICSKFKDEWFVSEYSFSLDLFKQDEEPEILAYGTEADIANYLWDNYEALFSPLSEDIDPKEIRERITANGNELEELLEEISTSNYILKLTDR
ncbi:hypothetical protein ACHAL6_10765 [Proteiniclasticum sp. C24MP]|uniref:hypothetical protein n=1 Tax=Proteiniclasticum sp. C24MP TaxID=3374101 RepID=UPI003754FEFA